MPLETYRIYVTAVAAFFAKPPDTSQLLVILNSLRHGLKKSVWTISGDLSANCVQMIAAAFGLSAIIAISATAFVWIKWLGVAYLAWIGFQLIVSKETLQDIQASKGDTAFRLYRQGFFTSMANPFAVVFFGALFPQFINPANPILVQLLILATTYIVIDAAILLLWGWLGSRAAHGLTRISLGIVNKMCGLVIIGAAVLLARREL